MLCLCIRTRPPPNGILVHSSAQKADAVGDRTLEADSVYIDSYSNYDIHHEMLSVGIIAVLTFCVVYLI